jgi:hypothetical protein
MNDFCSHTNIICLDTLCVHYLVILLVILCLTTSPYNNFYTHLKALALIQSFYKTPAL